ncbi:MAG: hypothetical protein J5I98_01680 [Phaeodactylibacter sp.]|nr:hypothetical protein [Phaeodactylibacter sp.]
MEFRLVAIIVYLFFCWLVAYGGRRTRLGFYGVLIVSILITPLVSAISIVLFQPRKRKNQ